MSEAKVKLAAVNQNPASMRDLLRIVIVGHVDHGKSTLVGRMFHDTGSLPDGKYEAIKAVCEKRGVPFEWAFLMDALQAEREADLAGSRTGQELAQRHQIGISALAQPFAPRHHLVAKIAQMGDGAAEGGQTKLQEDAKNLGDAALWLLRVIIHSEILICTSLPPLIT